MACLGRHIRTVNSIVLSHTVGVTGALYPQRSYHQTSNFEPLTGKLEEECAMMIQLHLPCQEHTAPVNRMMISSLPMTRQVGLTSSVLIVLRGVMTYVNISYICWRGVHISYICTRGFKPGYICFEIFKGYPHYFSTRTKQNILLNY